MLQRVCAQTRSRGGYPRAPGENGPGRGAAQDGYLLVPRSTRRAVIRRHAALDNTSEHCVRHGTRRSWHDLASSGHDRVGKGDRLPEAERDGETATSMRYQRQLPREWNADPAFPLGTRPDNRTDYGAYSRAGNAGHDLAILLRGVGRGRRGGEDDTDDQANATTDRRAPAYGCPVGSRFAGARFQTLDLREREAPDPATPLVLDEHQRVSALLQEVRNQRCDHGRCLHPNARTRRDRHRIARPLCEKIVRETGEAEQNEGFQAQEDWLQERNGILTDPSGVSWQAVFVAGSLTVGINNSRGPGHP